MKVELQINVYGYPSYVQHVLHYYHLVNANSVTIARTQVGNVGGEVYWKWKGRNYKPNPGDLIFFDWQQDGTYNHVMIV